MAMLIKDLSSLLAERDDTQLAGPRRRRACVTPFISPMAVRASSSRAPVRLTRGVTHVWTPESITKVSESTENRTLFVATLHA